MSWKDMQMIKEIKTSVKIILFMITVIILLLLITIRYGVSKCCQDKMLLDLIKRPFIKNTCIIV